MALAAAQVVDALAARLVPLVATAGRVYTSRAWPMAESQLPAWRVTAGQESVARSYLDDATGTHTLRIDCSAMARATADLDDVLHGLAVGALPLLFAAPIPYDLQLVQIDRQMTEDGEAAVGIITLTLQAQFGMLPTAPETIL